MQTPDPIMVLRAQAGDRDALDDLLRGCQQPLHRYIASICGVEHADDALQETLLRIARKLRWLNDPQLFRAWAFRIATREALRNASARTTVTLEEIDEPAAAQQEFPFEVALLRSSVAGISAASRDVVTLHYLEELPLADVAAALEVPLGTVKSRLAYGLRQLRARLKESP